MPGDSARVLTDAPVAASSRSLSTARAVLRVFALLLEHPEGVRADEVAKELGKSVSTAYYLLTSLCEEGFAVHESKGVYRRGSRAGGADRRRRRAHPSRPGAARGAGRQRGRAVPAHAQALLPRRGQGRADRDRRLLRPPGGAAHAGPGLGDPRQRSRPGHGQGGALAARRPAQSRATWRAGSRAFTPQTIISPDQLAAELEQVRHAGYAVDREEFDENFCCIAAPVFDARGKFVAALGLSMTANVFDSDREQLAPIVVDVAGHAARRAELQTRPPAPGAEGRPRRPSS